MFAIFLDFCSIIIINITNLKLEATKENFSGKFFSLLNLFLLRHVKLKDEKKLTSDANKTRFYELKFVELLTVSLAIC